MKIEANLCHAAQQALPPDAASQRFAAQVKRRPLWHLHLRMTYYPPRSLGDTPRSRPWTTPQQDNDADEHSDVNSTMLVRCLL